MRSINAAAKAELVAGSAVVTAAVEILATPPIRVWGGFGKIQIGANWFEGIGDRGLAQVSGGALGASEQNVTLSLSGVEPKVLELLDATGLKDAPVTIWRMIFKSNGKTLLDAHIFSRGRLDDLPIEDEIGGAATIQALVETAARGLSRRGGRMRTDSDQRLIKPNDGFFKHVSYAGEKMLYWGGKKPAVAGSALGGSGAGGGGGGGREGAQNF